MPTPLTLTEAVNLDLITTTEALRFRLATYFEAFPVHDTDDMSESYGHRVIAHWVVDLILRGEEPALYDVEIDCSRRTISSATDYLTSTYCVKCSTYWYDLPVYVHHPTVPTCSRCSEGIKKHTTYYKSGAQSYNPCSH